MLTVVTTPKGSPQGRRIIKVAVTKVGKDAIEAVANEYGMKEQAVAGRIYEWFFAQDDIVQRAVLGLLQGLEVDAAARFMQRLAEEAQKKPTGPQPNGADRITRRKAVRTATGDLRFEE